MTSQPTADTGWQPGQKAVAMITREESALYTKGSTAGVLVAMLEGMGLSAEIEQARAEMAKMKPPQITERGRIIDDDDPTYWSAERFNRQKIEARKEMSDAPPAPRRTKSQV